MIIKNNDKLNVNNKTLLVKKELGDGGQGVVYLVNDGMKDYAFKCYKTRPSEEFISNLKNNISKGSPCESFLWPLEFIDLDSETCGYLMEVRPNNFVSFNKYLNGKVKFKDQMTLVSWCIELCCAFKKLHEKGLSYQDLNDGSFFLDPENGKLLICDNDNVVADKNNLDILGKMRYMAPEIALRRFTPDSNSDRFSLATILFLTLCKGFPFEGAFIAKYPLIDEKAEEDIYVTNPVFIYHKTDKSNRPIRGYHNTVLKRWPVLPIYIKEAFHKTFVDGIKDRENGRTREIEWVKVLLKYRDELITCGCGNNYIYGFEERNHFDSCPFCKTKTNNLNYLDFGKYKVVLQPGKCIYKVHLDNGSCEYNVIVGKVIASKNDPSRWGIKIKLDRDVMVKDKYGNELIVSKDSVIPIVSDSIITFDDETKAQVKVL